jgi:transportin-3
MFDICRELVKLAVTFGESHILLIASADPECLQLVKFICACVRNPEKEIVELTFDFWYSLKCQLTNNYPQSRDIFKPIFADVATILISHCRLPVVQNGEEVDQGELEEIIDFRKEATDVLVNVYELLFADYFNLCLNGIKQGYLRYQHDKQKWQLIESSLFAIVCVSDSVKEEQAANLIPIIRMFNEMPSDIHDIRRIQVQVLGSYAHWVGKQPEDFISHSINFALQSIWQFTHKVNASYRTAAVNAFCALCEKCEKAVATNHSLATNLIQTCLSKIDLIRDPNIQIKVYEGMSHLLVSVNNDLNLQLQLMQSILQAVFTRIKGYNSVVVCYSIYFIHILYFNVNKAFFFTM